VLGVQIWTLVTMGVISSIAGAVAGEPMFKIWAQELIPTQFRSTAQGVMIALTRVVAALVALWTPALLEASPGVLFWFVGACIAAGGLIGTLWISRFPRVADDEPAPAATVADDELAASNPR
jgi:inositol transporter-like SP family MFS transporter